MWRLLRQQCQCHPKKVLVSVVKRQIYWCYFITRQPAMTTSFISTWIKGVLQQYTTLKLWRHCLDTMSAAVCSCMHSRDAIPLPQFLESENPLCTRFWRETVLKSCAKMFSTPKKNIAEIEDAIVALFGGKPGDNLSAMRYSSLCQKVGSAKSFVTPEWLPPTSSATKYHALRSYLQVMLWMDNGEAMNTTEWGWELQNNSLVPVMMNTSPAQETLLKIIHCNCSGGCSTPRCTCKRHGLICSRVCGPCQEGHCDNMSEEAVSDEDENSDYWTDTVIQWLRYS